MAPALQTILSNSTMPQHRQSAIAHALPATSLSYEELVARFGEKHVASIYRMSGIRDRRVVAAGQCASDLAVAAARRLFAHTPASSPAAIDALIFVSQTPDYRSPATACKLQADLGLPERCAAFDMNQACAAFIFGLQVAHSMVVAQTARRVLLLNADAISRLINPMDRGLVTLHGDAATATLVEPADAGSRRNRVHRKRNVRQRLSEADRARRRRPTSRRAGHRRGRDRRGRLCRATKSSSSWTARPSSTSSSTRSRISSKTCCNGGISPSPTSISKFCCSTTG